MSNQEYKVTPQGRVGKTEVLFNGSESRFKELRQSFPNVKSSEIYPAIDKNYDFSMFFYSTDDTFVQSVRDKCKAFQVESNNASQNQPSTSGDSIALIIKTGLIFFVLILIYFIYRFMETIMSASDTIK